METKSYTVGAYAIMHGGKRFAPGKPIDLTEDEAKALGTMVTAPPVEDEAGPDASATATDGATPPDPAKPPPKGKTKA